MSTPSASLTSLPFDVFLRIFSFIDPIASPSHPAPIPSIDIYTNPSTETSINTFRHPSALPHTRTPPPSLASDQTRSSLALTCRALYSILRRDFRHVYLGGHTITVSSSDDSESISDETGGSGGASGADREGAADAAEEAVGGGGLGSGGECHETGNHNEPEGEVRPPRRALTMRESIARAAASQARTRAERAAAASAASCDPSLNPEPKLTFTTTTNSGIPFPLFNPADAEACVPYLMASDKDAYIASLLGTNTNTNTDTNTLSPLIQPPSLRYLIDFHSVTHLTILSDPSPSVVSSFLTFLTTLRSLLSLPSPLPLPLFPNLRSISLSAGYITLLEDLFLTALTSSTPPFLLALLSCSLPSSVCMRFIEKRNPLPLGIPSPALSPNHHPATTVPTLNVPDPQRHVHTMAEMRSQLYLQNILNTISHTWSKSITHSLSHPILQEWLHSIRSKIQSPLPPPLKFTAHSICSHPYPPTQRGWDHRYTFTDIPRAMLPGCVCHGFRVAGVSTSSRELVRSRQIANALTPRDDRRSVQRSTPAHSASPLPSFSPGSAGFIPPASIPDLPPSPSITSPPSPPSTSALGLTPSSRPTIPPKPRPTTWTFIGLHDTDILPFLSGQQAWLASIPALTETVTALDPSYTIPPLTPPPPSSDPATEMANAAVRAEKRAEKLKGRLRLVMPEDVGSLDPCDACGCWLGADQCVIRNVQ